jgi:parallel beta-helix repeat protein
MMKRILVLSLSVLVLLGAGLLAQAADDPAKTGTDLALGTGVIRDGVSYAGKAPGWTIYVRPGVRYSSRERAVGYLDFLVPLYFTDKSLLYFNPKASFDNHDNVEWNIGVGYRHLLAGDKLILGGNVFYDGRKSGSGHDYHEIGVGAEVLTEWVNARVNGYIPLSDAEKVDQWREYYMGPTSLNYSWAYRIEEPMSGLDYEIGFKVPGMSNYVETWVYGGGYNYFSDYTDDMVGWSGRIEMIPADFLKVNLMARDDNLRDTEFAGEVTVELPFSIENLVAGKNPFEGIGSRVGGSRTMKERLYEQVRRDVDITVNTADITRATHPDEVIPGDPSQFRDLLFVSPTGNPSSAGTQTDPTTLTHGLAIATDMILFYAGTYNNTNLTIPSGITLWGPGYDPFGVGLTGTAVINGAGATTMFLGSNSTVWGLSIANGTNGIWLDGGTGNTIAHNNIYDILWDGIVFINGSNNNTVMNNTFSNNGWRALSIWSSNNNTFSDNVASGSGDGFTFVTSSNNLVTNNIASGITGAGIIDNGGSGNRFIGNEISGSGVNGFIGSTMTNLVVSGNTFSGFQHGVVLNAATNATVSGNTISGVTLDGIIVQSNSSGVISGNTVSGGDRGINISNNVNPNITFSGNTVNSYAIYGIYLFNNTGTGTIGILNNTVTSSAAGAGIVGNSNNATTDVLVTISGNTISGNTSGTSGGYGVMLGWGAADYLLQYNTITGNNQGIYRNGTFLGNSGTVDLGGGSLGSAGHNNIYGNLYGIGLNDVENVGETPITAQFNWWGSADGPSYSGHATDGQYLLPDNPPTTDFSNWLTAPYTP